MNDERLQSMNENAKAYLHDHRADDALSMLLHATMASSGYGDYYIGNKQDSTVQGFLQTLDVIHQANTILGERYWYPKNIQQINYHGLSEFKSCMKKIKKIVKKEGDLAWSSEFEKTLRDMELKSKLGRSSLVTEWGRMIILKPQMIQEKMHRLYPYLTGGTPAEREMVKGMLSSISVKITPFPTEEENSMMFYRMGLEHLIHSAEDHDRDLISSIRKFAELKEYLPEKRMVSYEQELDVFIRLMMNPEDEQDLRLVQVIYDRILKEPPIVDPHVYHHHPDGRVELDPEYEDHAMNLHFDALSSDFKPSRPSFDQKTEEEIRPSDQVKEVEKKTFVDDKSPQISDKTRRSTKIHMIFVGSALVTGALMVGLYFNGVLPLVLNDGLSAMIYALVGVVSSAVFTYALDAFISRQTQKSMPNTQRVAEQQISQHLVSSDPMHRVRPEESLGQKRIGEHSRSNEGEMESKGEPTERPSSQPNL